MSKSILAGLSQGNPYCDPYLNQYGNRDRAYEEAQMRALMQQQHYVSDKLAASPPREPRDNPILLLLTP